MDKSHIFSRSVISIHVRRFLHVCVGLIVAMAALTLAERAIAQQTTEMTCSNPNPMNSPVWRNFMAFVNEEYGYKGTDEWVGSEAEALVLGHALGRVALAQGNDPLRQEGVACLQLALKQHYARIILGISPRFEARYELMQSTSRGYNDDRVKQLTGVTSHSPAYGVFGASTPLQPPQAPPQPTVDGQHCANITANSGWQAVAVPKGFNGIIQIEGSWNVHHAHGTVGPEGYAGSLGDRMDRQYPQHKYNKGLPFAALMMRNGSHGPVSWVQSREHMAIATGPDFQFRINDRDDALSDNKGALTVCMSVGQHGMGGNAKPNPTPVPVSAASCFLSYEDWSISEADRLTTRAERMERGVETCYSTEDHRKCRQAADLAHSALVHITQWFARTRDIDGHCLLCDLTEVSPKPSAIGARLDELSYKLFRKGLGSNIGSGWGGQYADFEKEDLCVLNKPRKGGLSISPVAKDDCPKHCADAAPNCKYAYYNDKTRTCSWDDDQSTPNLTALKSGDIWDGAKRRWLGHAGNASLSGNRVFVLDKVVFSKYQTPTDICGATMTCKHEKRALPGNRTLGGTETEDYYSISEGSASFRFKESFRTGGQSLSNYSAQFTFEAPPPRIRPGETLRLRTQGNIIGFIDGRGYTRSFAYYIKRGGQNSYFDKTQVALGTGELPLQGNRRNGQLSKSSTTAITIPASARKELIIGGKFGPDPGLYVDWIYKEQ